MTENNLQKFFDNLTIERERATTKYVYFTPGTGIIEKITNRPISTPGYECLAVDAEQVDDILSGKKRIIDFTVNFNLKTKQLELREYALPSVISVTDKLYKIPKSIPNPDLYVNCYNNKWILGLNSKFRNHSKSMLNVIGNLTFNFSITDKNDPNVLHSSFVVQLYDLIESVEFDVTEQISIPKDIENISIYTFKYFDTYSYEIINE
jgi:hypothetical protein